MIGLLISESVGAIFQLILFSLIPLSFWLLFAKKKESNFFKWIGIKKPGHVGKRRVTICAALIAAGLYVSLAMGSIAFLPEGVTAAGSSFADKGFSAFPAVLAYGFIRTGLSEEIVFRGFLLKRFGEKFGFMIGNVIQAVLFGMMHGIPFGIATHSIPVAIVMTLLPGAFGWFQGWMNEKRWDGSIIPSWLLHGTINVVAASLSL